VASTSEEAALELGERTDTRRALYLTTRAVIGC